MCSSIQLSNTIYKEVISEIFVFLNVWMLFYSFFCLQLNRRLDKWWIYLAEKVQHCWKLKDCAEQIYQLQKPRRVILLKINCVFEMLSSQKLKKRCINGVLEELTNDMIEEVTVFCFVYIYVQFSFNLPLVFFEGYLVLFSERNMLFFALPTVLFFVLFISIAFP